MKNQTYTLTNGLKIPSIGFGTWQTPDGDVAYQAVSDAILAGYRHIDTAAVYGNEESVGKAINDAPISRSDIFLTSKLWNNVHTYEDAKNAINQSLKKLGTDYLDLYLIHWPNPESTRENWETRNREVWRAMEEAYAEGKLKAIGVSNFRGHHLSSLLETAKVKPLVNQIYLSPSDTQDEVVAFNQSQGILTQAYSPLGTGTVLDVPEVKEIADKYQKTPAQVLIRWSLQKGFNPLPKSVTTSRIKSNLEVFDFELSDADIQVLDGLKACGRVATNPDATTF